MLPAGNRMISSRQMAAATSLVALLACLTISIKRNSIQSTVANHDELAVLDPNATAICGVKLN